MHLFISKLFLLITLIAVISCSDDTPITPPIDKLNSTELMKRERAGGITTVFSTSSHAFSIPAEGLSARENDIHLAGDADFEAVFVTSPAILNEGLGPIFSETSCVACHPRDGRPPFPSKENDFRGFLLRVSLPGLSENGAPIPVPGFGTQIQDNAVFGYTPEADIDVTYEERIETFSDGTKVTLTKPIFKITNPYIPFPDNALISPRMGMPVFGLGLLEAIPENDILSNQDINDLDNDGISGKANYVHDVVSGRLLLGRFGWKANAPNLTHQSAAAYHSDMGITNPFFTEETGKGQSNGEDLIKDDPEISMETLDQVVLYTQTLAVPAARDLDNPNVVNGAQIFETLDCAKCHIPEFTTGINDIAALSNQKIFPYTDMLLHDMGDGLSDNRPDFLANGNEWRTRPLWGIGLTLVVNGHTVFLHDGRAKNITEAILWHGGEAEQSKQKFLQLSKSERDDLLQFINSL